jgi:hypothetical protein
VLTGPRVQCQVVQRRANAGQNCQLFDIQPGSIVKNPALASFQPLPDVLDGGERFERAGDELRAAAAARIVAGLRLHELGVGENDPELVVQSVKKQGQIGVIVHGG